MKQKQDDSFSIANSVVLATKVESLSNSFAFQETIRLADRVAPTKYTVLILGETGTGKEVMAHYIHQRSAHAHKPFVEFNCSAISGNIIESELFGHSKGAYTGALTDHIGYFQKVGDGTLLLDEIGELSLKMQSKLLRVLEDRSYYPMGSTGKFYFKGRIIAATHRNLYAMVKEGTFREDLYHRLALFVIELPTLAQRKEDIPTLVDYFSKQCHPSPKFSSDAIDCLMQWPWPGNIRELRNLVNRLSVFEKDNLITAELLSHYFVTEHGEEVDLSKEQLNDSATLTHYVFNQLLQLKNANKLQAVESWMIEQAMQQMGRNKTAVAQLLGVHRKVIERRIASECDGLMVVQNYFEKAMALVKNKEINEAIPLLQKNVVLLSKVHLLKEGYYQLLFDTYQLLGVCFRSLNGWNCLEARSFYDAAHHILQEQPEIIDQSLFQFEIWTIKLMTFDLSLSQSQTHDILRQAQSTDAHITILQAQIFMLNTLFWLGENNEILEYLAHNDLLKNQSNESQQLLGQALNHLTVLFEGLSAFQIGAWDQAHDNLTLLSKQARTMTAHTLSQVVAYQSAIWLACVCDDRALFGALSIEMLQLTENRKELTFYYGFAQLFHGYYLMISQGQTKQAKEMIIKGYDEHIMPYGGSCLYSLYALFLGETLLQSGEFEQCEAVVSRAIDWLVKQKGRAYLSKLQCLYGRLFLAMDDLNKAEHMLHNALSTAQILLLVPTCIHASLVLAQLYIKQDQSERAYTILSAALEGVSRKTAYPILCEAITLFESLPFSCVHAS